MSISGFGSAAGFAADEQQANPAFHSPLSDFWHVHDFDPGDDGAPEILWVRYRNATMIVTTLEAHLRTEQAVVPLETTCLMLTRASTTRDLVGHLVGGAPVVETRIVALAEHGGPMRVTGAAAP